ncbi:MAG: hypothetical protein IPG00_09645 [Saprospiraceae bacterium]|nr:hypothetical protein [Saprospiraceae bacterium]
MVEILLEIFALIGLMLVFRHILTMECFCGVDLVADESFLVVLEISFNEHLTFYEIFFPSIVVIPSCILGYFVL